MTKCILIFKEIEKCIDLLKIFEERSIFISKAILIKPNDHELKSEQAQILLNYKSNIFKIENIENNRILNPKLDRKIRQNSMKNWLMPFDEAAEGLLYQIVRWCEFDNFVRTPLVTKI